MADTNLYIANKIADSDIAQKVFGTTNRMARRQVTNAKQKVDSMHTQYIYSTSTLRQPRRLLVDNVEHSPRGKCGQTHHEGAKIRVEQQDGTSCSETLLLLCEMSVPKWITDRQVREQLCKYNPHGAAFTHTRVDKEREWIDFCGCQTPEEMVSFWKQAINELWFGVPAQENFPPIEYQAKFEEWFEHRIKQGADRLLLNAIMRAGKCFMTYRACKKIGAKTILVITNKPAVKDSWAELTPSGPKSHKDFMEWEFHDYTTMKGIPSFGDTTNVLFISLQYINKHFKEPTELMAFITNVVWDVIVFDEQHEAIETDKTKRFLESVSFKILLELSGTPFKTILSGRIPTEDTWNFDYIEEQQIRQQAEKDKMSLLWALFKDRAKMHFLMLHVSENIRRRFINDESGFTFKKLFAVSDGSFNDRRAVEEFLAFVYSSTYKHLPKKFSTIKNIQKHSLWILPDNVEAIAALYALLSEDDYFKQYYIINASGKNVKKIGEVNKIISEVDHGKHKKRGTITLTCDRFLEGTTVPEWISVHQMNNDRSAAAYFQGSFRNKSPLAGKENVMVWDYDPQRCIETIYNYCLETAVLKNISTEDRLGDFLAVTGLMDFDHEWNDLEAAEVIKRATADIREHSVAFGDIYPDPSRITTDIITLLEQAEAEGKLKTVSTLNDNDIPKGKDRGDLPSTQPKSDRSGHNAVEVTIKRIRLAMKRLPEMIGNAHFSDDPITTFEQLCQYPNEAMLIDHTGISRKEWTAIGGCFTLIETGKLNRRIDSLNHSGIFE